MRIKYKAIMDVNLIAAKIKQGILKGTIDQVKSTKKQLKGSQNDPRTYQDRGGALSQMLKVTGLDQYTLAGKLKLSWHKQIDEISVKYNKDTLGINLFNPIPLDQGTKWIGLKYAPKFQTNEKVGNDAQQWRSHDRSRGFQTRSGKLIQKLGGFVVDGFRPLPNSAGRGFTWATNPYKGRGYWLLYTQGFVGGHGGGINYAPRKFIHNAYFPILGESVARILGTGVTMTISDKYKMQWGTKIATRATEELRK